jgi:Mn2+/Fe2+ NRAMP family transporter
VPAAPRARLPAIGVDGTRRALTARFGLVERLRERIEDDVLRLRPRFRRRGLLAFLAVMGPGLIAGVAGNDAGGITTYSVLGAETGLRLLWLFPITIVILALVQEMVARLGVVTGQGLSDLIRDVFGVRWTAFAMLVLLVANVANTVAEFAGAAGALEIFGVPRFVTVPVLAVAIWSLVLLASYRTVERVFLLVSLVFLTYVAAAILARPDWGTVGRALVTPNFDLSGRALLLAVALVGTTITPYMQFYLQSAVAEKGIDEEELRLEQADAVGGAIWTNVIAVFIVVATAQTLFAAGIHVTTAEDAAHALTPVAGNLASTLFAVGLFGASALAAVIMPVSTAFVICEAFGWESGVGHRVREAPAFFLLYTIVLFAGAIVVLIPGLPLIELIVNSQNLQALLLPFVLVFILLLVNNRRLLGRHANGRARNALAISGIAVVIVLDVALLGGTLLEALGIAVGQGVAR